jgi:hypothetical protein
MVRVGRSTEPPHIRQWRGRDRNRETIRRQLGVPDSSFGLGRGIAREGMHPAIEHNGIELDEVRDPFGNPIGDPGDRHTTISTCPALLDAAANRRAPDELRGHWGLSDRSR